MILFLALLGLLLASYTFYVKQQLQKNKHYKPACDINNTISCSQVLKSPYANLFYLPNALYGIILYLLIIAAQLLQLTTFLLLLTSIASIISLVLFYLLLKLKKTCLVCIASYLINIGLFLAVLLTL